AAWPVRREALPASGGPAAGGGVEAPAAPQTVLLQRGAVATSGIARRHWQQGEQRRHHLLDPRTGLPAQSDLWSVTVVAARCVQAKVAAKVAFILDSRQWADCLRRHRIAGMLVGKDGTWESVEPWPAHLTEEEA